MNYYFGPVNLNQWNLFKTVKNTNHIEPFLAVKGMEVGDIVLLHVGSQRSEVKSGIYAYGKVVKEPYILENAPEDYCNGKNTVDVKIEFIDRFSPIITHEDAKKYIKQFRTVHKISEEYYEELNKEISEHLGTKETCKEKDKLTGIDLEVAEQLLLAIKNGEQRLSYKELSDRTKSKPNPHFGLTESLYRIGNLCFELKLPFITFLVVSEGRLLPGEGCRILFSEHGVNVDNMTTEEIYLREKERIINCTEWKRLSDYLGLNIVTSAGGEVVFPDDISSEKRCIEGAKKTIKVNAYERDRNARRQCLNYYKETQGRIKCQVCGFDFGEVYGEEYNNLIHVHHIRELSTIGDSYVVNPIKDLLPVCPNCHMVLHSKVGESIEELKNKFGNN